VPLRLAVRLRVGRAVLLSSTRRVAGRVASFPVENYRNDLRLRNRFHYERLRLGILGNGNNETEWTEDQSTVSRGMEKKRYEHFSDRRKSVEV
jgi:hypothetical protein